MRTLQHLITGFFAFHAAIHVLGLLKWGRLAQVPQLSWRTLVPLTDPAQRVFAGLWAGAFVLLIAAAALRLLQRDVWWAPALAGIALSQALIVMTWSDAKFGTLPNVLLIVPAVAAAAHFQFSRRIDRETQAILADAAPAPVRNVITAADLARTPIPVRRWLEAAGVLGRVPVWTARLDQRGELRTAPDAAWLPATAEQYFTVVPPAFVWRVDTTMLGFLPVAGRDILAHGRGEMLIKAGSLLSIVRAADEKIDHGALLRFLGEMVWFPSAALAPYVSWEEVDHRNARATLHVGVVGASAVFHFDDAGRVLGLDAERYLGGGAAAELTPWSVTCSEWGRFQGIQVPVRGEVRWILPSGPFSYYRWEVLNLEFDGSDPLDTATRDARLAKAPRTSSIE